MLGDVIKKGKKLESQKVRLWKAQIRVENARQSIAKIVSESSVLLAPEDWDDGFCDEGFEFELEQAERHLENAEYELLQLRQYEEKQAVPQAQSRAMSFSSWALLKLRKWSPEPMHPFFDIPMQWIHSRDDDEEGG